MNIKLLRENIITLNRLKKDFDKNGLDSDQLSGALGEAVAAHLILEELGDETYEPAPPRAESIDGVSDKGTYSIKFFTLTHRQSSKIKLHDSLYFDWLVIIMNTVNFVIPRDKITREKQTGIPTQDRIDSGIIYVTPAAKNEVAIAGSDINMAIMHKHYKLKNTTFLNEILYNKDVTATPSQLALLDTI